MYRIYSDDILVYDPLVVDKTILSGKLKQEVNTSGTLKFKIPKSNPAFGHIKLMKSIITLYEDDRLLFRGRPYSPNISLFRDDEITCEGDLAFFNDTYMAPFEYELGPVSEFLQSILDSHNSQVSEEKKFKLGNVTVENSTDSGLIWRSSIEYLTTWEVLRSRLFETNLEGYLWIRHETDGTYLDYLEDLNFVSSKPQPIQQTLNLLDAQLTTTSDELATVIVPLGARLEDEDGVQTDERLTIANVNEGKIYVEDDEAVTLYGRIAKIVTHDDVTDASNLLRIGKKDLANSINVETSYEFKAADLFKAGFEFDPFYFGTYVDVSVPNLEIDKKMLIKEIEIDILDPSNSTLSIGDSVKSLTGETLKTTETISELRNTAQKGVQVAQKEVRDIRKELISEINSSAESIYTSIQEAYYDKSNMDELLELIRTSITQTAAEIRFDFNAYINEQNEFNANTDARFLDIRKYIRFVDGNIVLGVEGNELILRIQNDKIVFLENGAEIAYWENRKFYAVDGEFLNSLRLGKFAFIPRPTGNLSFKKVVD